MESKRQINRIAITVIVTILTGCSTAKIEKPQMSTAVELGITQVGFDKTARYVYCEQAACPRPTPKTPIDVNKPTNAILSTWRQKDPPTPEALPAVVHVQFKFNSSVMSQSDISLLMSAAKSATTDANVEIIARSDFVGPPSGQRKIANARFHAMQKLVAKQAPGVRILEQQEIAGPDHVDTEIQSTQRRGTVRFIPPIPLSQKGDSK
jgi:hypothetical protein